MIPNHKPHWANFGLRAYNAHSHVIRENSTNDHRAYQRSNSDGKYPTAALGHPVELGAIPRHSLDPRGVAANVMIGPFIHPKILALATFPEVDWRYLVEDQIMLPQVWILHTLLS